MGTFPGDGSAPTPHSHPDGDVGLCPQCPVLGKGGGWSMGPIETGDSRAAYFGFSVPAAMPSLGHPGGNERVSAPGAIFNGFQ